MPLQKAIKHESKARITISGPSGSGKTFTALSIAAGLAAAEGKRVAFLDTEHGSASKYAGFFDFDVDNCDPPFTPDRYIAFLREAAQGGYGAAVIDSGSHFWFADGGLLDVVDTETKKSQSKNAYTAGWRVATPMYNRLIDATIRQHMHVIVCLRSKVDYVQETVNGKTQPRKIGLAPIMRDGFDYEFDIVAEMDADHNLIITKSRFVPFDGLLVHKPTPEFGAAIAAELHGAPAPARSDITTPQVIARIDDLGKRAYGAMWAEERRSAAAKWASKDAVSTIEDLKPGEADEVIAMLEKKIGADAEKAKRSAAAANGN